MYIHACTFICTWVCYTSNPSLRILVSPRTPSNKLREIELLEAVLGEKVKVKEKPVPVPTLLDDDAGDKKQKDSKSGSNWRWLPTLERECIIIGSIGDCLTPSVDAVPKLRDTSTTESELLKRELEAVQKKMKQDSEIKIVDVYSDIPGAQKSKEYYLKRIELLMIGCELPGGEHK